MLYRAMSRVIILAVFCCATLLLTTAARAQSGGIFDLSWNTIDGGGGTSSGGAFVLSGTIGQPDAGPTMTGTSSGGVVFSLSGGFWPGVPSGTPACSPADIAQTDGSPGPDGCVNNGDFLLFISSFFTADCPACGSPGAPACTSADIAQTDGSEGADGCVDNGDFLLFISSFFTSTCPGC
jgi:hypothetical protein